MIKLAGAILITAGLALLAVTLVHARRTQIREAARELALIQGAGYVTTHRAAEKAPSITQGTQQSGIKVPPKKRTLSPEAEEILRQVEQERKAERSGQKKAAADSGTDVMGSRSDGTDIMRKKGVPSDNGTDIMRKGSSSSDDTDVMGRKKKNANDGTDIMKKKPASSDGTDILRKGEKQKPKSPAKEGTDILRRPSRKSADEEGDDGTGILPPRTQKQKPSDGTDVMTKDPYQKTEDNGTDILKRKDRKEDATGILRKRR